jgi:hypothetical protein
MKNHFQICFPFAKALATSKGNSEIHLPPATGWECLKQVKSYHFA